MIVWLGVCCLEQPYSNVMETTKEKALEEMQFQSSKRFSFLYELNVDVSDTFELVKFITDVDGGRTPDMGRIVNRYAVVYVEKTYPEGIQHPSERYIELLTCNE